MSVEQLYISTTTSYAIQCCTYVRVLTSILRVDAEMPIIIVLDMLKVRSVHILGLVTDKVDLSLVTQCVCDSVTVIQVQVNTWSSVGQQYLSYN